MVLTKKKTPPLAGCDGFSAFLLVKTHKRAGSSRKEGKSFLKRGANSFPLEDVYTNRLCLHLN